MGNMHLQNQGERYEEEEFEEEDLEAEGEEDTVAEKTTICGIPKKIFLIGVIVLAIIILILVIFAMKKGSSKKEEVTGDSDDTIDMSTSNFYGLDGMVAGSYDGDYDGANVYDLNGNIIGFVSSSGTYDAYDSSGVVLFKYVDSASSAVDMGETTDDGFESVSMEDVPVDDGLSYEPETDDEYVFDLTKAVQDTSALDALNLSEGNLILKSYGYTGDEIELAQSLGLSVEQLVSAAQAKRDEVTAESLERMSDHASKEFQMMYNYSQYSMPHYTFYEIPDGADKWVLNDGYFIVNADYEKCPTYGYQLQLKVKIANGTYVYMNTDPYHWEELADEGNIVVRVDYILYGQTKKKSHLYVTGLTEINTTNHSVNASDSGSSLSDLVDTGESNPVEGEAEEEEASQGDDGVVWN